MTDLRIGVIGSGGRGRLAEQAHLPGEGSRVVACCDRSPETLEMNREVYGADIFTTDEYRALLRQNLDAVFVCVPDFLHEEMAVAALGAGKAVYLEKPMAITVEGCDRILRAAHETRSRLFVGHNMRHMPFVLKMKELIDAGAIGEVKTVWCRHFIGHGGDYYFKDWHAERRYSNGLLLQKAAHDIDVMHWLAGSYSKLVNALGGLTLYNQIEDRLSATEAPRTRAAAFEHELQWPPLTQTGLNATIEVEDVSMLQAELRNGVFVTYQQCHFTPDNWRNYTVIGTEGRIENFGNGEEGTTVQVWNKRKDGYAPADEVYSIPLPEGGHGGADPVIVEEFLRFVREGGETNTSPLAARFSVAAGCAATASLRNGGVPNMVSDVPQEWWRYFNETYQGTI